MQEQRKPSVGSALVDVFDAGVALVKAEINSLVEKLAELAKAKGVGIVVILAALAPLTLFAIFLIMFVYFGLVALGMPWWGAALTLALVSLALAVGMIAFGVSKLGEKLPNDQAALSEDERLEAEYLAEKRRQRQEGKAVSGAVVATGIPAQVQTPAYAQAGPEQAGLSHIDASATPTVRVVDGDLQGLRAETVSGYTAAQTGRVPAAGQQGYEQPTSAGAQTIPVYEPGEDGEAQFYGSGLNDKLADDHHAEDPNIVHPERLEGAPEVEVSTTPTYREDMERGNS